MPGTSRSSACPHRTRADQQRLFAPAPVEDPVGEHMSAIEIGAELDFVDGDEFRVEIARHRLDRGNPVARAGVA